MDDEEYSPPKLSFETLEVQEDDRQMTLFETGSVRDTQDGKPRYGLIPPGPKRRLAMRYAEGADKYGEWNWTKGQPITRCMESLIRHLEQYQAGEDDEDHMAAVVWNAFAVMYFEGTEMDDRKEVWPWL